MKRQVTNSEKIFVNYVSDKRLVSIKQKEFLKLNNNSNKQFSKKCTKDMNRHFNNNKKIYGRQINSQKDAQQHQSFGKC